MTLGEKIKFLRKQKGFTQETLAEELNVSRSAVAKWESNSGVPEISNLKMLSQIFNLSIDELLNVRAHECISVLGEDNNSEYMGRCYDIVLGGWNDGVWDALVLGEDEDFLIYQKYSRKRNVYGMIGKKYITSIKSKKDNLLFHNYDAIDRIFFCGKRVCIELACKEGFFKGFFDFRNDDYLDVVIDSFENSALILKFGKEINIRTISKLEEL